MKVLITGTSKGIGLAIAKLFLEKNHDVIGIDRLTSSIEHKNYIHYKCDIRDYEKLPDIDLYMDQVLSFINDRTRYLSRNPNEDKLFTKTMINNYAKTKILPPPVKKKYSREHVLMLIFIYYLF